MPDDPETPVPDLSPEERDLGMDADITRRDFLNAVALGTGAALLGTPAPAFRRARSDPSDLLRPIPARHGTRGRGIPASATTRFPTATRGMS